jgi:hypothetical protein
VRSEHEPGFFLVTAVYVTMPRHDAGKQPNPSFPTFYRGRIDSGFGGDGRSHHGLSTPLGPSAVSASANRRRPDGAGFRNKKPSFGRDDETCLIILSVFLTFAMA